MMKATSINTNAQSNDWRLTLFGDDIRLNPSTIDGQKDNAPDVEQAPPVATFVPTLEAFDPKLYDYIAIFIGANYCPHCREFAPTVASSVPALEQTKRCKVVFASNDRDEDNFEQSRKKNAGIDVMPYDVSKTQAMRDLFGLKTIPAFMIIKNDNFQAESPTVVTNARHKLVADPFAKNFPWTEDDKKTQQQEAMSTMERFWIQGKYGHWWQLGHHANPEKPDDMYMDEHAVRIRAGILNSITWIALMNVFFWKDQIYVHILFPLVAWEFLSSMTFGMTPLAPIGTIGTLLAILLTPAPHWKPARPKRFAWAIGLTLATLCFTFFSLREELGSSYRYLIAGVVLTCNVATWLESSAGFCLGCFVYNNYLVPWLELEQCQECQL
ncbi:nucleoredoxin-like [Seminavis robusta]|uniref:Nucleoredoxin-like n=1 Tax=Seminavis robusta TaxID=568900 RepID=A0A9N8E5N4_9STRA|nr:nucleoredoxin-like [Seminavis robusta]|eukprot:Sro646_g180780.1 nucleoredoxin-like (383) ;mRNA; f:36150-37298